jgi:LPS-assembly protein
MTKIMIQEYMDLLHIVMKIKQLLNNGIFTSCKINDNCPPWSIKAEKITHDKIKKDMIYENAILKIYDVPVLYFPKFFHPDPSVKRRRWFFTTSI